MADFTTPSITPNPLLPNGFGGVAPDNTNPVQFHTHDGINSPKLDREINNAVTRALQMVVFDFTTNVATGDGKFYLHIDQRLDAYSLVDVHAEVITAGSRNISTSPSVSPSASPSASVSPSVSPSAPSVSPSQSPSSSISPSISPSPTITFNTTDIQIHNVNNSTDILSQKLTIDSGETGSDTALVPAVINHSYALVRLNDVLRVDVDAVSEVPPKGLIVTLGFA